MGEATEFAPDDRFALRPRKLGDRRDDRSQPFAADQDVMGLLDGAGGVAELFVGVLAVVPDVVQRRVADDAVEPGCDFIRLVAQESAGEP